ncbi:MAG TPA: CAP domain-containing protein [Vulgatibacter sp.]|nr:CAP domain-containing protein [Vulgatibacter sp.]
MLRHLAIALALLALPAFALADPALDEEEIEFLHLINAYRAQHGAPCLSPSPTMNEAADYMSREMGEKGFLSHNEPPCDETGEACTGRDPFDRIEAFGHVGWTAAGENIAAGTMTAQEAFEVWRDSPGHDANMRAPDFTAIGIGRVEVPGSRYRVYWTTNFSNLVDGPWGCEGPVEVGTGGAGGGGGGSGGGSGGCSAAGSAGGLLGFAAILGTLALRRRRA